MKKSKTIRIALSYDYNHVLNLEREGCTVYLKHLVEGFIKKYNATIEIWCFQFNKKNFKKLYNDLTALYPNNFLFFCYDKKTNSLISKVKLVYHTLIYFFFNRHYQAILDNLYQKNTSSPKEVVKKFSKADFVICEHPVLQGGLFFDCPKFLVVHDLFTILLKSKFKSEIPNIDYANSVMLANIQNYLDSKNGILITSSDYTRRTQIIPNLKYARRATYVIPFPPMISAFNQKNYISEEDFRSKYKVGSEKYIFLASQNRPNKNWIIIMRALAVLKKQNFSVKFVTTGHLKSFPVVFKEAKKLKILNSIVELGTISKDDLYFAYKYASLVVSPSIIEGFGMTSPILEALQVGNIPIISVKSLGMKESLESVGLSFTKADLNWVNLYDYRKLAENIIYVIRNPRESIEKQSNILNHYKKITWEKTAEMYVDIFEEHSTHNVK